MAHRVPDGGYFDQGHPLKITAGGAAGNRPGCGHALRGGTVRLGGQSIPARSETGHVLFCVRADRAFPAARVDGHEEPDL